MDRARSPIGLGCEFLALQRRAVARESSAKVGKVWRTQALEGSIYVSIPALWSDIIVRLRKLTKPAQIYKTKAAALKKAVYGRFFACGGVVTRAGRHPSAPCRQARLFFDVPPR